MITLTTQAIIEKLYNFSNGVTQCIHADAAVRLELMIKALNCSLRNMSRDQQATMINPSYEEAEELLK